MNVYRFVCPTSTTPAEVPYYLEYEKVLDARTEELGEVAKHQVYYKVPIKECWDNTGKAPIKTRWIDINKGAGVRAGTREPATRARTRASWVVCDRGARPTVRDLSATVTQGRTGACVLISAPVAQ